MNLKDYISKSGIRKNFFCEKAGLSVVTLWDILKKGGTNNLKLAIAIEKATEGKVSCYDLVIAEKDQGQDDKDIDSDKKTSGKAG